MNCPACHQTSRFYEPGSHLNFCEHCGAPLDRKSDEWVNRQVAKDLARAETEAE